MKNEKQNVMEKMRNLALVRAEELMRHGKLDDALKCVDKAIGVERITYSVRVMCKNCGYEGTQDLPKGTSVIVADCTNCGCTELVRCDVSDVTNTRAVMQEYLDNERRKVQPETLRKLMETINDGKKIVEKAAVKAKAVIKERKYEEG